MVGYIWPFQLKVLQVFQLNPVLFCNITNKIMIKNIDLPECHSLGGLTPVHHNCTSGTSQVSSSCCDTTSQRGIYKYKYITKKIITETKVIKHSILWESKYHLEWKSIYIYISIYCKAQWKPKPKHTYNEDQFGCFNLLVSPLITR